MAEINKIAPLVPVPGLRRHDPRRQHPKEHQEREPDGQQRPRDDKGQVDEYV
ncbi:MAG: hypothetical protein R3310_06110 [Candidatus Competibacteraceae bacterium]|nr:hypothetical protein [Candidatus Competibacteraceae bacterium]